MKKVIGVLMILIGIVLSIPTIQGLVQFLLAPKRNTDEISYSIGYLIGQLIMCAVIFVLIKYGLKFQKRSK